MQTPTNIRFSQISFFNSTQFFKIFYRGTISMQLISSQFKAAEEFYFIYGGCLGYFEKTSQDL